MCWYPKKKLENVEQSKADANEMIKETEAYWMQGYECLWNYTIDNLVRSSYRFGTPVIHGKINIILDKKYGCWHQRGFEIKDDSIVIADDAVVFQSVKKHFCWIDTEEEWRSISDDRYYYDVFVPRKVVSILSGKYSEAFSLMIAARSKESKHLVDMAITLYDEGLSPDMRAYLLFVNNEEKRTG